MGTSAGEGAGTGGSRLLGSLALVLSTVLWAGNFVIGAIAVETMDPLSLAALRWAIAAVPLLVIAQLIERPDWRRVLRATPLLVLVAMLGLAGYNLLLYESLRHTTAVSASLINALNPALIMLLATALLRERLGWRRLLGMLIGFLGVAIVVGDGSISAILALEFNIGDLLMLVAIVAWTFYTVLARRLAGIPPITTVAAQAVITAAVLVPISLVNGMTLPSESGEVLALGYIVLCSSIGAYLLWNLGLRRVPAASAGMFLNLVTVFTVAISVALGAALALADVLGGALVLGGVLLANLPSRTSGSPRRSTGTRPAA